MPDHWSAAGAFLLSRHARGSHKERVHSLSIPESESICPSFSCLPPKVRRLLAAGKPSSFQHLFHDFSGVRGLHAQRNGLTRERLDEGLHAPQQAKSGSVRNLIFRERMPILQIHNL